MNISSAFSTRFITRVFILCTLSLSSLYLYGDTINPEEDKTPPARLEDYDLSLLAQQAIGMDSYSSGRRCTSCHHVSAQKVIEWGTKFTQITKDCFKNKKIKKLGELTREEAKAAVQCLSESTDSYSFHPSKLGLWAGAAEHLEAVFKKSAIPDWQNEYRRFLNAVRMPMNRNSTAFSVYDVEVLTEWIKRDYVYLDRDDDGSAPPNPSECTPLVTDKLKTIITEHASTNWGTINKSKGVLPFACTPNKPTLDCFNIKDRENGRERFPLAQDTSLFREINTETTKWNIRYITQMPYNTIFWTRSSADGQFSAAGVTEFFTPDGTPPGQDYSASAAIIDYMPLLKGESPRVVPVLASYDPSFFADNSGFAIQGATDSDNGDEGTIFCQRKTLTNRNIKVIKHNSPNCSVSDLSLYHSTGVGLKGDDYLAVAGDFNGDAGDVDDDQGDDNTSPESELMFKAFVFDGKKFKPGDETTETYHYERDFLISPSANLLTSRFFGYHSESEKVKQDGFNIRLINKSKDRNGHLKVSTEVVGRFCERGSKAPFSTNQRFVAFFRFVRAEDYKEFGYTSPDNEDFQNLVIDQTSNVYVHDLLKQKTYRLTNMKAGYRAVFPHFRTDDWLMFLVKEPSRHNGSSREHMMTSDIALRISN